VTHEGGKYQVDGNTVTLTGFTGTLVLPWDIHISIKPHDETKPIDVVPLETVKRCGLLDPEVKPNRREGCTFTWIGTDQYLLYGGREGKDPCESMVFHRNTNSWSIPTGVLGETRTQHSAVYLPESNHVLVHGGMNDDGEEQESTLVFDCDIILWYNLTTTGTGPSPREGHGCCVTGTGMFVFGGKSRKRWLDDLYRLDTVAWRWNKVQTQGRSPAARAFHGMCATSDDKIVVCGGLGKGGKSLDDFHVLNYVSNETAVWSSPVVTGSAFSARCGHSLTYIENNNIMILGGSNPSSKANSFREGLIFDVETCHLHKPSEIWSEKQDTNLLNTATTGHGCAFDGSRIICFGGRNGTDLINDLQIISTVSDANSSQVPVTATRNFSTLTPTKTCSSNGDKWQEMENAKRGLVEETPIQKRPRYNATPLPLLDLGTS